MLDHLFRIPIELLGMGRVHEHEAGDFVREASTPRPDSRTTVGEPSPAQSRCETEPWSSTGCPGGGNSRAASRRPHFS
jgi:hypothetical protein